MHTHTSANHVILNNVAVGEFGQATYPLVHHSRLPSAPLPTRFLSIFTPFISRLGLVAVPIWVSNSVLRTGSRTRSFCEHVYIETRLHTLVDVDGDRGQLRSAYYIQFSRSLN